MVERDEASPKLGIPNPSRSGNRFLEAEPAARNNRNQGKCLGTKLGALQTLKLAGLRLSSKSAKVCPVGVSPSGAFLFEKGLL